jgi:hypothetical protein
MESLTQSTHKKSEHAALDAAAAVGNAHSGHVDAEAAQQSSILGMEFSAVGQPSASGTYGTVHQTLENPEAKLCCQSTQEALIPTYKMPERFTTMAEVKILMFLCVFFLFGSVLDSAAFNKLFINYFNVSF